MEPYWTLHEGGCIMNAEVRMWRQFREYTFAEFIFLGSMWLCIQRYLHEDICHVVECEFYVNYLNVYWQILCGQNEWQWFLYVLWDLRLEGESRIWECISAAFIFSKFVWICSERLLHENTRDVVEMWTFMWSIGICIEGVMWSEGEEETFEVWARAQDSLLVCALNHFLSGCWV